MTCLLTVLLLIAIPKLVFLAFALEDEVCKHLKRSRSKPRGTDRPSADCGELTGEGAY